MRISSLLNSSFPSSISSIQETFNARDADRSSQNITCPIQMMDGSAGEVTFGPHFKPQYKDEYTGDVLPQGLVQDAMVNEMTHFTKKVWEITSTAEALKTKNPEIVGGRWVTCNKWDLSSPKVRCGYGATELNT